MRLALVHDWLNQMGGAEDVLETLVARYPAAPVHTSIYWREGMPAAYREWDIRTTWMDHLPGIHRHHRPYLPLYPVAFAGLDLAEYDVVLSNKSGFCHGVHTGATTHICYCLAPTRYVWEFDAYTSSESPSAVARRALRPVIALLRRWDYRAAQAVTHFIAISRAVQQRIRAYYGRESVVIHPPVDTSAFATAPGTNRTQLAGDGGYYLIVSRLIGYRGIDLAVRAFNQMGRRLVIAGEGPDQSRLQRMAGPGISLLGRVPREELIELFANCRAYVLPGVEDFGIAPLQAQAAGRPVIAFAGGGALETVIDGETGLFFNESAPGALAEAVVALDGLSIDAQACRANADRFASNVFEEKLDRFVTTACASQSAVGT